MQAIGSSNCTLAEHCQSIPFQFMFTIPLPLNKGLVGGMILNRLQCLRLVPMTSVTRRPIAIARNLDWHGIQLHKSEQSVI